jgi:hypothetical protein
MTDFPDAYSFTRGATIRFVIRVKAGTVIGNEIVTADGKAIETQASPPPGDVPPVDFSMVTDFRVAEGEEPDRWYLTIPADVSETLVAGTYYACDARIDTAAGDVIQEQHWVIYIRERVSRKPA